MNRNLLRDNRFKIIFLLVTVVLLILARLSESVYYSNLEYRIRTRKVNSILAEKEKIADDCLNRLRTVLGKEEGTDTLSKSDVFTTLEREGISLLWYFDKKLVHWTDNSFEVPLTCEDTSFSKPLAFIHNGWFLIRSRTSGNEKIILLLRLTHEFGFENDIVKNGFVDYLRLPENTQITFNTASTPFNVTDGKGSYLFSLAFPARRQASVYIIIPVLLWTFALLALLVLVRIIVKELSGAGRSVPGFVLALAVYASIYLVLLLFREPRVFFETGLFSEYRFSLNSFIPSLGHLLIISALSAELGWLFFKYLRSSFPAGKSRIAMLTVLALFFAVIAILFYICHLIFTNLIVDSNISFEPYKVLDLSFYSFAGFLSVVLLFLAPMLILQSLLSSYRNIDRKNLVIAFTISLLIFVPGILKDGLRIVPLILLYSAIVLSIVTAFSLRIGKFNITVIFSLLFGLYSLFYLLNLSREKNDERKKIMAVAYSSEHDPKAENLLLDLWNGLSGDTTLKRILSYDPLQQADVDNISRYLHDKYFGGYWGNFNMSIVTCGNDSPLWITSEQSLVDNCFDFFTERIRKLGHRITGTGFWFLDDQGGRSYYLGQLFYNLNGGRKNGLFIELYSDVDAFQAGYSELLLDKEYYGYVKLKNFSFAKYINGNLVLRTGNFPYDKADAQYVSKENDYRLFRSEGYDHVLYKNGNITVMISEEKLTAIDIIISFAYVFAFIMLVTNLLFLFASKPDLRAVFFFNLRQKLQLSFIALLLVSFVTVGIVVAFFSIRQYQARHLENIKEKISSVSSELESVLSTENNLTPDWRNVSYPGLNELLISLSNILNTDINLYSKSGYLMATSRPEVFNRDLTSRRMNMDAYNNLSYLTKSEYIQKEKIASMSFMSAYIPFYNSNNKLLAYLNLPYFRMQSILARDISNVIVAVTNFTLLLIIITMVIAVFISGRLTSPLRMLSEGISSVGLGRKSVHLSYSGHDEITDLVNKYNTMVDELEQSAAKLANSEREFAWREMAKQVAHEIKNPLTPMKLNIQQLYKSWKDGIPGFDRKLERFTKSQIENIETLSSIASAFSSFAKMPAPNPVEVNIVEQVRSTLELFKDTENISFRFGWPLDTTIMVRADREHLNGIFSNLIKNAIQSVPQEREGVIRISIELAGDKVVTRVEDNGTGIPGDLQKNLFTPNFTTKSSGMGLGLSIVKRYVESAGGRIWFESEYLKGSSFFVELPVIFTVERR
ncbi:MAG: HAMP domain-containing sensor histidine kinase [Bacteroidales bacterium]